MDSFSKYSQHLQLLLSYGECVLFYDGAGLVCDAK